MSFTPRERVLCALNHEEPDRVPLFIGTSGATTLLAPAYEKLKAHLGMRLPPTRLLSQSHQYVWMDEEMLVRLGSDGRTIAPGPPPGSRARATDNVVVDDWGTTWERDPGSLYFEVHSPPLKDATIDDLDRYPWPNLTAPSRFVGLSERARAVQDAGYATVLLTGITMFEQSFVMRGLDTLLMDMVLNEEFFTALLTKMKSVMVPYVEALLREVGPYTDVFITGDDLGTQHATMISPRDYRRLLKPHHAELLATIKRNTRGKVFFHSDGNIHSVLGDLVDIGVDLLNPVQVSAGDMGDTARLKREFGKKLAFCGGIDTQWALPHGTPDDVRKEVRRRMRDLGPGGGYVVASVHCIQPDVPPENVVAMCEETIESGHYPLRLRD